MNEISVDVPSYSVHTVYYIQYIIYRAWKYFISFSPFRQLELETSARHSETMKVGDRNWFVDVGLLNVHKVGGWESDDHEHLSVIIWQEEATREVFFIFV